MKATLNITQLFEWTNEVAGVHHHQVAQPLGKAVARKNVWGANLPIVSVYITLLQGHFNLLCTVMVIANLVRVLGVGVGVAGGHRKFGQGVTRWTSYW